MIDVQVNAEKQLITLSYSQRVEVADMEQGVREIKEALEQMKPGFRLLNDLTRLDSMDPRGSEQVIEIMKACNEEKISTVVRVIPDPTKDIGFNIMSRFHYSPEVKLRIYENLEDAVRSLE